MSVSVLGVSIPIFWLGLLLILAFGRLLPSGGNLSPELSIARPTGFVLADTLAAGEGFADALRHLVLPALTLATVPMSITARVSRAAMLEVLGSDYVRTARAKGLSPERVVLGHALRNALVPIVTVLGLEFAYLLGGAVLTETVFAWPGLGTWIVEAAIKHDYPAINAGVLVMAAIFVGANLAVDVLVAIVDPRIRA
jgi:peptide/nickel transport system permease protein